MANGNRRINISLSFTRVRTGFQGVYGMQIQSDTEIYRFPDHVRHEDSRFDVYLGTTNRRGKVPADDFFVNAI